tara:strand:+ start:3517 stop:5046 length:1530 start_codon:yes stop_codon:yes gene_type:complete
MIEKFKEIFEGNTNAYGQLVLTGQTTEKGKAVGKAFIKREPIPDQLWQEHIDGKDPALGVIPINQQNMCRWGCIDVDDYIGLDHISIMRKIKGLSFPLVTFRSKSGGAHLFLFTSEFIQAGLMQQKLKDMAKALDFGDSEIFPKQTELLVDRGDTGNFLNLPYHGDIKGMRYTFKAGGEAATLAEFLEMYSSCAQTKEQVESIKIGKIENKSTDAFIEGPPCLNKLAEDGFGDGSRNNGLFNIAVYRKQADPDTWEDKVMEDNQKFMDPPLGFQEVKQLLGSIGKRGYDKYRCKDQPICMVCNAAKCRTKKFGVGYEEEQMPELGQLTKINSDPTQYFLDIGGSRVNLTKEQLHNPNLFSIEAMDKGGVVVPIPKQADWRQIYLKPLIDNQQVIEPLESLNPVNQLEHLLYEFTVHRSQARKKEDIMNKSAWTEEGFTYFKMEDFYSFAKRNNWEVDKVKTGNLIKQLEIFVDEVRMQIGKQTPRCIKIKAMIRHDAQASTVPYDEAPF